uniref:Uncharacterized protein n=1 Tax=Rangifer tarandus platyrhynchus TaxID=3082113 RepID=A0ACB0FDJ2_RANTA|nr:unnamed protein product [Rangifer tarandus platyrhynchus]
MWKDSDELCYRSAKEKSICKPNSPVLKDLPIAAFSQRLELGRGGPAMRCDGDEEGVCPEAQPSSLVPSSSSLSFPPWLWAAGGPHTALERCMLPLGTAGAVVAPKALLLLPTTQPPALESCFGARNIFVDSPSYRLLHLSCSFLKRFGLTSVKRHGNRISVAPGRPAFRRAHTAGAAREPHLRRKSLAGREPHRRRRRRSRSLYPGFQLAVPRGFPRPPPSRQSRDSSSRPESPPTGKIPGPPSRSPCPLPWLLQLGSAPTSCWALGRRARAGVPGDRARSWPRPGRQGVGGGRERPAVSAPSRSDFQTCACVAAAPGWLRAPCVPEPVGQPLLGECSSVLSARSARASGPATVPAVVKPAPSQPPAPAPCGVRTRGRQKGAPDRVGCFQGDLPSPGLERGRLVPGDIVCPLAPTPETRGANAPGGSKGLSLKSGKPARLRPPAPTAR